MPLSLKEVDHIASLARLELTSEEKDLYRDQLSAIVDYIDRLKELEIEDIPPMSGMSQAGESHLRLDEPQSGLERESLLANAPEVEEGQFKILPVFE